MTKNDGLNREIIQWGYQYLSSHGYVLTSNFPENVQNTPWSYVIRFATLDGYIYLKHTPNLIALEAIIIRMLSEKLHVSVPEVIAHNAELNCFLMKDAGNTLREILKKQFDVNLLCKAIEQFTSLQISAADHVDIFIDIGVPDWRLDKLPHLYRQLLLQKDILRADGITEIEINELEALIPKISNLCQKLAVYSIKQTIVQPDFNDNNMLIDNISQKITSIDLGEIVISHPFFSLLNCLLQIRKHHALTETDDAYIKVKGACLKNFMDFESKEHLLDAFATAEILWRVYWVLAQYRLMMACGTEEIIEFQPGRLRNSLKELMSALDVST